MYYGTVKPQAIMLGKAPGEPIKASKDEVRSFHNIKVWDSRYNN
jgi:hypothetical protein